MRLLQSVSMSFTYMRKDCSSALETSPGSLHRFIGLYIFFRARHTQLCLMSKTWVGVGMPVTKSFTVGPGRHVTILIKARTGSEPGYGFQRANDQKDLD